VVVVAVEVLLLVAVTVVVLVTVAVFVVLVLVVRVFVVFGVDVTGTVEVKLHMPMASSVPSACKQCGMEERGAECKK
jgi:hypothetical protein